MRRSAGLAASLFLTALGLAGCGHGAVIGGGPLPSPTPAVPKVLNEFAVPTSGSQPGGIALGSGGYFYFTEQAAGKIGQMTPTGGFQEFTIGSKGGTTGNNPIGIAGGLDGNLWFTEQGALPGVAMMAPVTDEVTEYPVTGSSPTFITPGPLTNTMFFMDPGQNAVGEILTSGSFAPAGAVTPPPNCIVSASSANVCEFFISNAPLNGTPNAGLTDIAINSGDSTHVYFTENAASQIGILDVVNGTLAEVKTPTASAGPVAIVQGADGAMWFTENGAAKIGRITVSGQVNEYPLAPATSATALVLGADNNLYFADPAQNKIGRINGLTASNVTEYDIPAANALPVPPAFPGQMILGSDGRIYLTEVNANKIAQITY